MLTPGHPRANERAPMNRSDLKDLLSFAVALAKRRPDATGREIANDIGAMMLISSRERSRQLFVSTTAPMTTRMIRQEQADKAILQAIGEAYRFKRTDLDFYGVLVFLNDTPPMN